MTRFLTAVGTAVSLASLAALVMATPSQENRVSESTEASRKVALQVWQKLRTQLIREMQLSGPLRSLLVCKYTCLELLSAQSRQTGWRVAAVSLKPRNTAQGMPDTWEQKILADFNRRAAKGEAPDALEFAEIVTEPQARFFRYAKAIVMEPLCLPCHGARDKLPDLVKAQLSIDYPFDKAVDFKVGQVYGIISIKQGF